ncbi:hypothetical protein [Nitrobacter sp. JJSN]|uniref:hypothetical protein n=1 Tax=Nitrobacter sp. JJSN TaxID=3453033 RepID=UPI003F7674FB
MLNGATFKNSDYPDLARVLATVYAQNDYKSLDTENTILRNEPHEMKPSGEVVRGLAVCPSKAICGDLVGTIQPFNLDASCGINPPGAVAGSGQRF